MDIKNYMEDLVMQQMDAVITANADVCNCKKCRDDIAAIALTILPARYVATSKGETYTRIKALEQQFAIDIMMALTEGIKTVKKYPQHEAAGE